MEGIEDAATLQVVRILSYLLSRLQPGYWPGQFAVLLTYLLVIVLILVLMYLYRYNLQSGCWPGQLPVLLASIEQLTKVTSAEGESLPPSMATVSP